MRPLDVLLLDAQYRQGLTCMRVYGRSGLTIGAAACRSEASRTPSFRSRWCAYSACLPDLSGDDADYVDAVLELLDASSAAMVLPAHDGSIELLAARRAEIEKRCALPLPSEAALSMATSKPLTLALAVELGIRVPESATVTDQSDLLEALAIVGLPAVLKPMRSWVIGADGEGTRLVSGLVQTREEALVRLEWLLGAGASGALLQPWLPGRREAITLFRARDRVWARFAQVSHREWPALGGASVLCESVPLCPDIDQSAERLVEAMGIEGCAMVEFRRDAEGHPVLMEVNPRMGSSVALAVRAGVNFPGLLYSWAMGYPLEASDGYRIGDRLRWLVGDMWFLNTALYGRGHPDVPTRAQAVRAVLKDLVVRPRGLDLATLTDPRPELAEIGETVRLHAVPKVRRGIQGLVRRSQPA